MKVVRERSFRMWMGTMNKITLIFVFLLISFSNYGQNCLHTDLSKSFDFKIKFEKIKGIKKTETIYDSCRVSLTIFKKSSKQIFQKISYDTEYLFFDGVFADCNFVRSYSTGKNKNLKDLENDFGDFIIADFNFDEKDDFAIKSDWGGNGGPTYNFYIQNKSGNFIKDKFLSNNIEFFPANINQKNKTFTTSVRANTMERCKDTFKFNSKTKKWKRITHTFVKY